MSVKEEVIKRLIGNPRCPKCNSEITWLRNYQSGKIYYMFDPENSSIYEENEFQADSKVNYYNCPQCAEILFTDEEKALKFLRGDLSGR